MPKIDRKKVNQEEYVVVKHSKTGQIRKIVFPHISEFGIPGEPTFNNHVLFYNGLTGSLTQLVNGDPYLVAGPNILLSTGSDGAVTISSIGVAAGAG